TRHVGRFRDKVATVLDQFPRVLGRYLVLGRAWKSAVTLYTPGPLAGYIFRAAELFGVLVDTSAAHILNAHHEGQFFFCDAVLVVDKAAGVRHADRFSAALNQFFHSKLRCVTGT